MIGSLYDAKPFTTYKYYENKTESYCSACKSEGLHYYLKYRIFFGISFPLFPVATTFYKVCPYCGTHKSLTEKNEINAIKLEIKGLKPRKYNKYSQLDLDGYEDDTFIVFGTSNELNLNILMHLKDIKKNNIQ